MNVVMRMKSPAGRLLGPDKELERRIDSVDKDAPISDYFRVLQMWKVEAVARSREAEQGVRSEPVGV